MLSVQASRADKNTDNITIYVVSKESMLSVPALRADGASCGQAFMASIVHLNELIDAHAILQLGIAHDIQAHL